MTFSSGLFFMMRMALGEPDRVDVIVFNLWEDLVA